MRLFLLLATLAAVFFFISCGEKVETGNYWYPLAAGNRLEYDGNFEMNTTTYFPDTVTVCDTIRVDGVSTVVGEDTLDDGTGVWKLEEVSHITQTRHWQGKPDTTFDSTSVTFGRIEGDSIYHYMSADDTVPDAFPVDLSTGLTWTTADHITYTVGEKENVTVPAGSYDCFKISLTAPDDTLYSHVERYIWNEKKVGRVRLYQSWKMENPYVLVEFEGAVELVNAEVD